MNEHKHSSGRILVVPQGLEKLSYPMENSAALDKTHLSKKCHFCTKIRIHTRFDLKAYIKYITYCLYDCQSGTISSDIRQYFSRLASAATV